MKADTFNIIQRLFDTSQMILKIPVYQRNYDWTEGNVRRLLEDVENVIKNKQQYFIGAIVYMESDNNDLGMPEFLIIDGQQRITTLTILLQALKDLCVQSDQQVLEMIDSLLTNKYSSDEYKIKLKPIKSDNIQYERLLNGNLDDMDYNGHIYKNYKIAKNIFSNWINNGIKPIEILLALKKLQVVGISLKSGEDDPQIIFESINSTGVALTNTDLIRNFLLMGDQDQDKLFEEYWLPIENKLRKNNNNETLDLFFRQYVITKSNSTITERKVYSSFINLFRVNNFTHEPQLKELNMYANIYATFLYPNNSNYNDKIKGYLLDLKQLKQSTCYPFLMHVFKDYENKIIDEETLSKVLSLITIYLIRRSICNVPTNSLNTLFAYLYVRVFKVTNNKNKYYESINKYLFSQKNKDEIPNDENVKYALEHENLYQNKELCRLLMLDIENNDFKEKIDTDNLTIEHIMPQTLSNSWKQIISDEEHDKYVHTLGNLSITGYNSELSNKSFKEKKKLIKENSKIQILNQDVINQDSWTINNIKKRAIRLSRILLNKYYLSRITDPSIEFELVDKLSLSDLQRIKGRKPVSFTLQGANYTAKTFKQLLIEVVQLLDQDNPKILDSLIGFRFSERDISVQNPLIGRLPSSNQSGISEIRDGIYLYTHLSAVNILKELKLLFKFYNISEKDFTISVRKQ